MQVSGNGQLGEKRDPKKIIRYTVYWSVAVAKQVPIINHAQQLISNTISLRCTVPILLHVHNYEVCCILTYSTMKRCRTRVGLGQQASWILFTSALMISRTFAGVRGREGPRDTHLLLRLSLHTNTCKLYGVYMLYQSEAKFSGLWR